MIWSVEIQIFEPRTELNERTKSYVSTGLKGYTSVTAWELKELLPFALHKFPSLVLRAELFKM